MRKEHLENSPEREKDLKVMQEDQCLQTVHQDEGEEERNPSHSSKDTPIEEGELTSEHDKVSRLTQVDKHLQITPQNGCKERSNLSLSSKDDCMNTKDGGRN